MDRTKNSDGNRNGQGQWAEGNAGGPGNPKARYAPFLRNALNQCITIEMVQDVVNHIYQRAMSGDLPAARLFLQYAVGKPARIDSMDERRHDSPPEMASMPQESSEQAASDPVVSVEQTAAVEQTVTKQTAAERATSEATVDTPVQTPAVEQTVPTAVEQTAPPMNAGQANGEKGPRAPRSVAGVYPDVPRMG